MSESETNKPVELDVEHARRLTERFKPIEEAMEEIERLEEECAALRAEVDRLKAELAVATSPEASEAIAQSVYEEIVPKVVPLRARQVEGLLKERDAARAALANATALLGKRVRPIIVDTIGYRRNWCMGDPFGAQVALLELDALLAAPAPAKEENDA